MTEAYLELKLRRAVEKAGGQCWKFVSPGVSGVPDRIVLLPKGNLWFVEVKKPGKTLDPLQTVIHKILHRLGFKVFVVDSDQALKTFITLAL